MRHGTEGGWKEIWRSLESVEFFDLDAVTDYLFKLASSVTVAKVGFYLERLRERARTRAPHVSGTGQTRVWQTAFPLEPRGARASAQPCLGRGHMNLAPQSLAREAAATGFGAYGGISRKDWRTVSPGDVRASANVVQRELVPLLRADLAPARDRVAAWTDKLVAESRKRLSMLLPLNDAELEFLRRLND